MFCLQVSVLTVRRVLFVSFCLLFRKTELAKTLAEFLFDDSNAMTRIDMSEYVSTPEISTILHMLIFDWLDPLTLFHSLLLFSPFFRWSVTPFPV